MQPLLRQTRLAFTCHTGLPAGLPELIQTSNFRHKYRGHYCRFLDQNETVQRFTRWTMPSFSNFFTASWTSKLHSAPNSSLISSSQCKSRSWKEQHNNKILYKVRKSSLVVTPQEKKAYECTATQKFLRCNILHKEWYLVKIIGQLMWSSKYFIYIQLTSAMAKQQITPTYNNAHGTHFCSNNAWWWTLMLLRQASGTQGKLRIIYNNVKGLKYYKRQNRSWISNGKFWHNNYQKQQNGDKCYKRYPK